MPLKLRMKYIVQQAFELKMRLVTPIVISNPKLALASRSIVDGSLLDLIHALGWGWYAIKLCAT